ncbi:CMRF35-like molecule 1 [Puntigrus tetrazona]|uniref:CMRF35-like molecule 1 n=1 Tax=Puntigrus tetrazona TaxID=1606681 RepID=UPI001C8913D7|nr:CMRF35-like molecule 1 [Puntigrus tetrazona]
MFIICFNLLLFSSISISTVVAGSKETVVGLRGHRLDINCSYEAGYESNFKYFCKGECIYGFRNIIVESGSPAKDERFSLTDNKSRRVFTVSISDLRSEDEGLYWCAVERSLPLTDVYSEIQVQVKLDNKTTEVSTVSSFSITPSYFSTTEQKQHSTSITITERRETSTDQIFWTDVSSVSGGLGSVLVVLVVLVILLVLVLCSLMFFVLKKRKRKSGTVEQNVQHNTESVHIYEIVKSDPGPSDVITAASPSNQTPLSHLNSRPHVSVVYASVTNQQPDSNSGYTHSTNQVTDTDCDEYVILNLPEPASDKRTEMIYSTVTHLQNTKTNDGQIYSEIKHT